MEEAELFGVIKGRKGENGCVTGNSLHLNAMTATISEPDRVWYQPFSDLSTYSQKSTRERKKEAKKEREKATTIFNQKGTFLFGRKRDISIRP